MLKVCLDEINFIIFAPIKNNNGIKATQKNKKYILRS